MNDKYANWREQLTKYPHSNLSSVQALELLDERDRQRRAIEVLTRTLELYGNYETNGRDICQALAKAERILKGEE